MDFRTHNPSDASSIETLFLSVFTNSEGESEGLLVSKLAKEMLSTTKREDLFGFVACDGSQIVGAILFSRLKYEADVDVFLLAPVAVATDHQSLGIGQALITHGLGELEKRGVEFVMTYGDPAFYSKVGFHSISPDSVQPPFALSQPVGWLGQSLTGAPIETLAGRGSCVAGLNDPQYW